MSSTIPGRFHGDRPASNAHGSRSPVLGTNGMVATSQPLASAAALAGSRRRWECCGCGDLGGGRVERRRTDEHGYRGRHVRARIHAKGGQDGWSERKRLVGFGCDAGLLQEEQPRIDFERQHSFGFGSRSGGGLVQASRKIRCPADAAPARTGDRLCRSWLCGFRDHCRAVVKFSRTTDTISEHGPSVLDRRPRSQTRRVVPVARTGPEFS